MGRREQKPEKKHPGRIAALLLAAALLLGWLLGLRCYSVLSGSMEPAYPTGALLITRPIRAEQIRQGTVLTFRSGEAIVTHRVTAVERRETGFVFRTKGDANTIEDGAPVGEAQVLGTPVLCLPGLGYGAQLLRRPAVFYSLLAAAGVLLVLSFLPGIPGKSRNAA